MHKDKHQQPNTLRNQFNQHHQQTKPHSDDQFLSQVMDEHEHLREIYSGEQKMEKR